MRIAIIGGDPHYLLNFRGDLISAMVSHGHQVLALGGTTREVSALSSVSDGMEARGARFQPFYFDRRGTSPRREAKTLLDLRRKLRAFRPQIVLSYTPKVIIYGTFAARMAGAQRVYALMTGLGTMFTDDGERSLKRRVVSRLVATLMGRALSQVDKVIFQNPDDRADLRRLGLLRHSTATGLVNGSGVDTALFAFVPAPDSPLVFTQISRVQRQKGVTEFAEAAARLSERFPEVEFRLVGPLEEGAAGIAEEEVKTWAAVNWIGPVRDVHDELARASVFVLPSYREGTPRSVLEALSVGRATITTDVPGCRETVTDGDNGFLVPSQEPGALADAMERFIEDRSLVTTMSRAARRVAEEKYDVHKVNRAMLAHMEIVDPESAPAHVSETA